MAKQGQGFSKMYTKSQYEGSYYAGANNHTSAADLQDAMSNEMFGGLGDRNSKVFKSGTRGGSAAGGRRARPMTAKVSRGGLH